MVTTQQQIQLNQLQTGEFWPSSHILTVALYHFLMCHHSRLDLLHGSCNAYVFWYLFTVPVVKPTILAGNKTFPTMSAQVAAAQKNKLKEPGGGSFRWAEPKMVACRPLIPLLMSPSIHTPFINHLLYSFLRDDDDINDVASMAGVNLSEESARILATNSELVGTLTRSCKDETFLLPALLQRRILEIGKSKFCLFMAATKVIFIGCG